MSLQEAGRLAMRVEGDWWVAYFALKDTMDGALELGRVQMAFVQDPVRKETFMGLMRDAVSDILKDATGADAMWPDPQGVPAPEHEKAGTA